MPKGHEKLISTKTLGEIERRLQEQWGPVRRKPSRNPLDELILTILSQNTSDLNSGRAFSSLRNRFADWDRVREAPLRDIEVAIQGGGLARIKAGRIKSILEEIHEERGEMSLDFLKRLSDEKVWAYLGRFKGVGPKTVACVMLFSLGRPAFPVDTHVHRVISRLAGRTEGESPAQIQEELQRRVSPDLMYSLHLHLVHHGRRICQSRLPLCGQCRLLRLCKYARGTKRTRASASRV